MVEGGENEGFYSASTPSTFLPPSPRFLHSPPPEHLPAILNYPGFALKAVYSRSLESAEKLLPIIKDKNPNHGDVAVYYDKHDGAESSEDKQISFVFISHYFSLFSKNPITVILFFDYNVTESPLCESGHTSSYSSVAHPHSASGFPHPLFLLPLFLRVHPS